MPILFFRDNGIVISISIAQWLFEYVNILFFHLYMHKFHGFDTLAEEGRKMQKE